MKVFARRLRQQRGSASFVEFVPVLGILMMFVFIIIDLFTIGTGCATCGLVSLQSCSEASRAADFNSALQAMVSNTRALSKSPLGQFARMTPVAGYSSSGADLYIVAVNIYTNKAVVTGPNKPLESVDTSSNVYECQTKANFILMPYLNMGAIPFLSNVSGLSKPFSFSATWGRHLEHPENFVADLNSKSNRISVAGTANQTLISSAQQVANWDWHNDEYSASMPGQKVLATASTNVQASQSSWTKVLDSNNSAVSVSKGQRFTILTKRKEEWEDHPNATWTTAEGNKAFKIKDLPVGSLVVKIGNDGQEMYAGYHFYDVEATTNGPILLHFNGSNSKNEGQQNVTVLVSN
jgi:hypothetical protein